MNVCPHLFPLPVFLPNPLPSPAASPPALTGLGRSLLEFQSPESAEPSKHMAIKGLSLRPRASSGYRSLPAAMETRAFWITLLLVLVAGSSCKAQEFVGLCKYLSGSHCTRLGHRRPRLTGRSVSLKAGETAYLLHRPNNQLPRNWFMVSCHSPTDRFFLTSLRDKLVEAQRTLTYSGQLSSSESAAGLEPRLGWEGRLELIPSLFFLCQRFLSTH